MGKEDLILEELKRINARLDGMDKRFDGIDQRLDGIDERLDSMDERLERLEESAEITRDGVNALLSWAEECGNAVKFPLPKIAK